MIQYTGESFDDLMSCVTDEILHHPDYECSPRGQLVREIILPTLVLTDPRSRAITNPARKANYGFAVGEFLWYANGRRDLKTMLYYNRRMGEFSDDGETLNSAYGHIMDGGWTHTGVDQIGQRERAVDTLIRDPDSRRCIIQVHQPWHQIMAERPGGTKDVPCTLSLQFMVRKGELHLHVHMRSCDIIWGLTNDLFSFTLFQEVMMLTLRECCPEKFSDLRLGKYYHTAGSLHVYERHFKMLEEMDGIYLDQYMEGKVQGFSMPPLEDLNILDRLGRDETLLRTREIDRIDVSGYSGACAWMSERLNEHRMKRDAEDDRRTLQA